MSHDILCLEPTVMLIIPKRLAEIFVTIFYLLKQMQVSEVIEIKEASVFTQSKSKCWNARKSRSNAGKSESSAYKGQCGIGKSRNKCR